MTTITVDQGQSLIDIAIQHAGDISAMFDIALVNDLSPTDDIVPGTQLIIPYVVDANLVQYLADKNYVPATGLSLEDQQAEKGGISYMGITRTFKVGPQ